MLHCLENRRMEFLRTTTNENKLFTGQSCHLTKHLIKDDRDEPVQRRCTAAGASCKLTPSTRTVSGNVYAFAPSLLQRTGDRVFMIDCSMVLAWERRLRVPHCCHHFVGL